MCRNGVNAHLKHEQEIVYGEVPRGRHGRKHGRKFCEEDETLLNTRSESGADGESGFKSFLNLLSLSVS